MMERSLTGKQAKFKVSTTEEDYFTEYMEYVKMLDKWSGNRPGREYVINELSKESFEVIATENGEN